MIVFDSSQRIKIICNHYTASDSTWPATLGRAICHLSEWYPVVATLAGHLIECSQSLPVTLRICNLPVRLHVLISLYDMFT